MEAALRRLLVSCSVGSSSPAQTQADRTDMADTAFVAEFSASLAPFPKHLQDNYEGNHARPVLLPELPKGMEPVAPQPAVPVKVNLRSIRAPKFSVSYETVDTDTIYAVKERLLSDPAGPLNGSDANVANVRFLLKSRAIADYRQLRELPNTDFTVMLLNSGSDSVAISSQLYWGDNTGIPEPIQSEPAAPEASDTPMVEATLDEYPPAMWDEIEQVLKKHVDNVPGVLERFRNAL